MEETQTQAISRNRRSSKEKRVRRRRLRILGYILFLGFVLTFAYSSGRTYFQTHFFPGTKINGVDCGMATKQQAYDRLMDNLNNYTFIVKSEEGDLPINAKEVGLEYKDNGEIDKILAGQSLNDWFLRLDQKNNYNAMETVLDDEMLLKTVESLKCMDPSNPRASENATIVYDSKKGQYTIKEGERGNSVSARYLAMDTKEAMLNGEEYIDLSIGKYYYPGKYTSKSEEVIAAQKQADKYVNSVIHYKYNGKELKVTKKQINKFIKIDESYNVTLDKDAIAEYIEKQVQDKFSGDSINVINSPGSGKIYVSNGDGSKAVSIKAEQEQLIKDIKAGKTVTREPAFISNYLYSENGAIVKDDYIDINISKQMVYVIINGKKAMETQCVTGNESAGRGTPRGIYKIAYKTRNHTMVKYNSFVYYWMPYDTRYGIGLHDATWRSQFGGNIYQTDGSHACINLPYEKAKQMYEIVYAGLPVIVHD